MGTPSGIVLPAEGPIELKEVVKGLFVAVNPYGRDAGYFGQSPLYKQKSVLSIGIAPPVVEGIKMPVESPLD